MGQVMFCSTPGHRPKLALCREKTSKRGDEGWGEEDVGKPKRRAVFFHPACVLRSSPPEQVRKTLCEDTATLPPPPKRPPAAVKEDGEEQKGVLREKIETSKNVTECSLQTERFPWQVFPTQGSEHGHPRNGPPWCTHFIASCLSSTAITHHASAGKSCVFLLKGTS